MTSRLNPFKVELKRERHDQTMLGVREDAGVFARHGGVRDRQVALDGVRRADEKRDATDLVRPCDYRKVAEVTLAVAGRSYLRDAKRARRGQVKPVVRIRVGVGVPGDLHFAHSVRRGGKHARAVHVEPVDARPEEVAV